MEARREGGRDGEREREREREKQSKLYFQGKGVDSNVLDPLLSVLVQVLNKKL